MYMKKILLTIALIITISFTFAQGAIDALRFSTLSYGGDARYMSMGGAFGALGANTSVFSSNPAGMGLYKRSDFSVTTSIMNTNTDANYNGTMTQDSRSSFNISNLGIVFSSDYLRIRPSGYWKGFQIGFGLNQLKNFTNRIYISGNNTANSIADMYAEMANGTHFAVIEDNVSGVYSYDLHPAWWTYLISLDGDATDSYYGADPAGGVLQSKVIDSWGSINEYSFAFSANYADRLYLGVSIGMPVINFHERVTYEEEAISSTIADDTYRSAKVINYLDTKGAGVNLKLGMIYRANDMVRFGFALHTPTYYPNLDDTWSSTISSTWDNHESEMIDSPIGKYSYDLNTPMRLIGSIAFVIGKIGLISLDYEYLDYSTAKFDPINNGFRDANDDIHTLYKSASNIRFGTEWRAMNFAFRGGFSYYGSPFAENGNDASIKSYSLGLGYQEQNFNLSLAWVYSDKNEDQYLYGYNSIATNAAVTNTMTSNFMLTLGMRF